MTKNRLQVLQWWLRGEKNNVGLSDLVKFFFAPSYSSKAAAIITKIEKDKNYLVIHLKDQKYPLFYPEHLALRSLNQIVVETFYKNDWHYYQIEETMVEAGDIVVDCGAGEGLFSLVVAPVCKKVYLIEPMLNFVEALKMTFHHYTNVEIIPCAVSDEPGIAFVNERGISSSLSMQKKGKPVRVETIDSLFYQKNIPVSYIKADLEGYDLKAIVGARKTIERYHPKIAVATYHSPDHSRDIAKFIHAIYPCYKFKEKGIYRGTGSPVMLHAWC